jgi:DNA helicase-2/ATP-dependent DNA helicase PcrA
MVAEELLKGLNPAQKQVASTTKGPLLVLAGAGTGKTRCVIYRAGYLIASGCVRKENLLIVTFTNKAARELRHRLADTFNLSSNNLWVGTFHSIFGRILRYEAAHLPFSANYVIYDDKDQKNLVKKIIKELNIDTKRFKPQAVRGVISRQKNNLLKPEQFWEFNEYNPWTVEVLKIYTRYQEYLQAQNALDFDDILMNMAYLLAENEEVRLKWQKKFQYIMIDEYQDTNYAQFEIINHLAKDHQNICVVGDDDQAIYTWRGATIKNILNFENDYENVVKIRLERNYRSHENILKLANSLISHNTSRHGKELYTDLKLPETPHLTALDNEAGEAEYIAELITEFHKKSAYAECAVLYRTNAQSRILEKLLVQKNIPYRIYGGVNFYQRKEIKDILCYLRLTVNPEDLASVQRALLLTPGVGKSTFEKITLAAITQGISVPEMILTGKYPFLGTRPAKLTAGFNELWQQLIEASQKLSIYDLIWLLLEKTGLGSLYGLDNKKDIKSKKTFPDPEFQSKYENICELLLSAREFSQEFNRENERQPDLAEYLASATLQTDLDTNDDSQDRVNLMTMHNAKGLEFDHVMIVGLEDGILPHRRALEEPNTIEEERRLLYVAITRARQTVHITLARWRRMAMGIDVSMPSRFIEEFDREYVNEQRYDAHAYLTPSRPAKTKQKPGFNVVLESEKHFKIGQKIKHVSFGFGLILSVDGQGKDARLIIKFDDGPVKKVLGSYVDVIKK